MICRCCLLLVAVTNLLGVPRTRAAETDGVVPTPFVPYASQAVAFEANTAAAKSSAAAVAEKPFTPTRIIDDTKLVPIHLPIHDTYARAAEKKSSGDEAKPSAAKPVSTKATAVSANDRDKNASPAKTTASNKPDTNKQPVATKPAKSTSPERQSTKATPPATEKSSTAAGLPQPPIPLK